MTSFLKYIESDDVDTELFIKKTIVVVGLVLISYALLRALDFLFSKFTDDEKKANKLVRLTRSLVVTLDFILILRIYFTSARAFTIMLGLLLAFIALAVKDLIIDVVAYLYISLRRPFSVGQVVEIEGVIGELVDIEFLQFNLLEMRELTDSKTHTGRYISMPTASSLTTQSSTITTPTPLSLSTHL